MPNDLIPYTDMIDSELKGGWRGQKWGSSGPVATGQYNVIQIGTSFWFTKALSSGNDDVTLFFGPYPDSATATTIMTNIKAKDGF